MEWMNGFALLFPSWESLACGAEALKEISTRPAHRSGGKWGNGYSPWDHGHNLLDTCWKAHHREEEPIGVEVLKHPLHRLPVDAERDAGHPKVQATAHHVVWFQEMLVDGGHSSGNAAWWAKNKKKVCGTLEPRGNAHRPPGGGGR